MTREKIHVLFNVWADADNTNAQSLNARSLALRLDPARFRSTLFVDRKPDPRLLDQPAIQLVHLPPRLRSLVIAYQLIWGDHDILLYPRPNHVMNWYRTLVPLGKRKKIIYSIEGTAQQLLGSPRIDKIKPMLREADLCCAISPHIAETVQEEFGIEAEVVPIGVDLAQFTPADRASHSQPVKVLYVGSLQPRKRVHLILDMAEQIGPERAQFHVVGDVIGSPTYRDELMERKTKDRFEHVHFHGRQPRSQVQRWMHTCDVLVLPSRLEGTPKVTFEAAATGLPCVIFEDYQTPSVVDGTTGFQVQTFEEMVDRLRRLIEDPDLRMRMGAAAVEHVKQFDWDVVVSQWEGVFEKAISTALPSRPMMNSGGSHRSSVEQNQL